MQGRLLFMTTNHRERLDPALVRPGRVDAQFEFGLASREQVRKLFLHFYHGTAEAAAAPALDVLAGQFAAAVPAATFSIAAIQGYLILHRRDPAAAVANAAAFVQAHGGHDPPPVLQP